MRGSPVCISTLARNNINHPQQFTVSSLITSAESTSDTSKELNKPRLSTKNQGFQTIFTGHPFYTQTPRRQMITNHSLHHGTIGNLIYIRWRFDSPWSQKMWTEEATRYYFLALLKRATHLHHTIVKQIDTSLSYIDNLTIMSKRSGLREDYANMENELEDFINYDDKFINQPQIYNELLWMRHSP